MGGGIAGSAAFRALLGKETDIIKKTEECKMSDAVHATKTKGESKYEEAHFK